MPVFLFPLRSHARKFWDSLPPLEIIFVCFGVLLSGPIGFALGYSPFDGPRAVLRLWLFARIFMAINARIQPLFDTALAQPQPMFRRKFDTLDGWILAGIWLVLAVDALLWFRWHSQYLLSGPLCVLLLRCFLAIHFWRSRRAESPGPLDFFNFSTLLIGALFSSSFLIDFDWVELYALLSSGGERGKVALFFFGTLVFLGVPLLVLDKVLKPFAARTGQHFLASLGLLAFCGLWFFSIMTAIFVFSGTFSGR